ncbi:co-regulatory protein PtrA N-terminal domain-containing protein [Pseudomonas aeruginosa]|uniref:co-regulatory protein PtrA N-terminal domain-containing protein n=1 Tax=Pseudomonas aeruginosa TaxID=287 RepID=UPI00345A99CA
MKSIKTLFVVAALSASTLTMAEGGADRTFARMEQARQVSLEAYQLAKQQKDGAPVAGSQAKQAEHANC